MRGTGIVALGAALIVLALAPPTANAAAGVAAVQACRRADRAQDGARASPQEEVEEAPQEEAPPS